LEQNREIWAVPGNITNPGSYGPNYLIKQGAKVVQNTQDILKLLPRDTELHIDQLLGLCPLERPKLNEALLHLEMMGLIRQWPGRRFSRRLD